MCCFSVPTPGLLERLFGARARVDVAGTRIFARRDGDRQALVYAMSLTAATEVAMILPLPVADADADALTFVDLSRWPDFFDRLGRLFPAPAELALRAQSSRAKLVVHEVGAFEASYVPTWADFDRLDARFRLPDGFLDALPAYRDHGFAVFRLKPSRSTPVHPMAFWFRPRGAGLFFPTVHVHDGEVHATAIFDHALYWQGAATDEPPSAAAPRSVFDAVPEVIDPDAPVRVRALVGVRPNADTWIGAEPGR